MERYELLGDGESKATATEAACLATFRLDEAFEDAGLIRVDDANALVGHEEQEVIPVPASRYLHGSAAIGELDRVAYQVDEHLGQLHWVPMYDAG